MMGFTDYTSPPEYESLLYLHTHLGDIKTVEYVCIIWNRLHHNNSLRINTVDNRVDKDFCTIILTGVCDDVESVIQICYWLPTLCMVQIKHEPTIISVEV